MRLLAPALMCATFLFAVEPNSATKNWWKHTKALSVDAMKGRDAGSPEYKLAARYVATQFERAGLKPAGENGGYFQSVPLHETRFDPSQSEAALLRDGTVTNLKWLLQIAFRMQEILPDKVEAPLVFAGTGAPPAGFEAQGRIVVQLTGHTSRSVPRGAVATLAVDNPDALEPPRWPVQYLVSMRLTETKPGSSGAMGFRFNPAEAELLFAGSGHSYKELLEAGRAGKELPWFVLPATLRVTLASKSSDAKSDNILAILPGSDPALADEYVAISAIWMDMVWVKRGAKTTYTMALSMTQPTSPP